MATQAQKALDTTKGGAMTATRSYRSTSVTSIRTHARVEVDHCFDVFKRCPSATNWERLVHAMLVFQQATFNLDAAAPGAGAECTYGEYIQLIDRDAENAELIGALDVDDELVPRD